MSTLKRFSVLAFVVAAVAVFGSAPANAANSVSNAQGPGVEQTKYNTNGNNYGDLTARWWQWILSIPAANNPNLDTTGADCAQGQEGQVWFLAGTFGGPPVTRSCTVPSGKSLFFPILDTAFGNGVGDCTGPSDCDINALRGLAAANQDSPMDLEATIDGRKVSDPSQYRVVSSTAFNAFMPAGNVIGNPVGTYGPLVSDGYFLLVDPPKPGPHTIHFKGVTSSSFTLDVTYNLTVTP
jgi:hypothetical protein